MTNPDNPLLDIQVIESQPPLLGRQKVHDERSRAFAARQKVDRSTWRDKSIRIYDPTPNPNQEVGCCTGVAKAVQFNAVGNRKTGIVLDMVDALIIYARNTELDPFPGTFYYDPRNGAWTGDDTGSSGLASAKSAQDMGIGGEYRWRFDGADGVIQEVMAGNVVSVGTWWYWDMFTASAGSVGGVPVVKATGGQAGGHQYVIRGYDKRRDQIIGRCWWGGFRDFRMDRTAFDTLLRDGGDAHVQARV